MTKYKKMISSYGMVTVGTFLMSAGVNMIYEPMSMVTGGFAGVGIIVQEYVAVPLWLITLVLNLPLFVMAGKKKGFDFVKKTLYGTLCYSFALAVVPSLPVAHEDYLMAALLGGALVGGGLAIVFRQGGSTGGTDLLSTILKCYFPAYSAPVLLGIIDGVIVAAGMLVFGMRIGLYSIVAVFVTSKLMDSILEGMKFAKLLYIISDEPEQIAEQLLTRLERGVTALEGRGMYSGRGREVLMCAVSRREAVSVMQIVREIDENAFVVLSDAREVMGEGF